MAVTFYYCKVISKQQLIKVPARKFNIPSSKIKKLGTLVSRKICDNAATHNLYGEPAVRISGRYSSIVCPSMKKKHALFMSLASDVLVSMTIQYAGY